ncbi:hypothetical protein BjapCC829_23685 [Bradyrhizobium barranii]|uniref:Uncharacterized protein n=1 Tax=Bradyrhizobium barranii TaxID=2992140 RepID=A0ABY3QAT3_9BRAD|nr:hypothetical protein [Bradyrhizobium japonicum]UFW82990.1 hypothetical protein BjapCC829_23685 [Bradyrhizobium japonicum]
MIGELGKLLGYGISGLGLALAILAYMLLSAEQKITKPRRQMITAIYVFMSFSLILTGVGLTFELKRLAYEEQAKEGSSTTLPAGASDQLWYDVLKATRQKFVGQAPSKEYGRGYLNPGESSDLLVTVYGGECRSYIVMTKPPAQIEVAVTSPAGIAHNPLAREAHFAFGRFCAGKTPGPVPVTLKVTMRKGEGPYVAETYGVEQ